MIRIVSFDEFMLMEKKKKKRLKQVYPMAISKTVSHTRLRICLLFESNKDIHAREETEAQPTVLSRKQQRSLDRSTALHSSVPNVRHPLFRVQQLLPSIFHLAESTQCISINKNTLEKLNTYIFVGIKPSDHKKRKCCRVFVGRRRIAMISNRSRNYSPSFPFNKIRNNIPSEEERVCKNKIEPRRRVVQTFSAGGQGTCASRISQSKSE